MILRIVLFLSSGLLVSSNNGYPIIPAQTCPGYQQNGYANPPANQPSDIASYLQGLMVQNQSPSLNLSPSDIRQILLNRILSNQPMQSNFDQSPRGYSSNFAELPNNAFASNGVNSYFSAPMANESVNNQQIGAIKEDKAVEIKTEEKRKKNKKRKSKSRRKHDESEKNHNSKHDIQDNDRETSKKSKKRSRKPKTEASQENHNKNTDNVGHKKTKKKKRKHKEHEEKHPVDEENYSENPKPRRRRKKKPKTDKNNAEKDLEQATTLKPTQIQEGINVAHFNEGIVEENRIPRNPIPEGNDLYNSIPSLPENFANSFNFNGMSQFNKNPAMNNFFANYENIYQAMMAKNKGPNEQKEIKIRRPPKSRNNIKRKTEVRNKNSTATASLKSPKPVVTPKVNVITTEKTIVIKEKTRANIDPIPKEENPKSDDRATEVEETVHGVENEDVKDMESNIDDPIPDYGYIDDYYPQFTDSAAYTANNKEVYIKNLGDTKYYYAVDKDNPEFINRMRFEGLGLPERIVKDYEVNKKYNDAEEGKESKSNVNKLREDVIQFRSPPQLETPDFRTRKVERSEIHPDFLYNFDENDDNNAIFLGDKASIYSEAKIPCNAETKGNSNKILKDKRKNVETVFARSKVATYGPVFNPEEDSASVATSNQDLIDDSSFQDGGTAYVLATSFDYPDSVW